MVKLLVRPSCVTNINGKVHKTVIFNRVNLMIARHEVLKTNEFIYLLPLELLSTGSTFIFTFISFINQPDLRVFFKQLTSIRTNSIYRCVSWFDSIG